MTLRDELVATLTEENETLREKLRLLEQSQGLTLETPLVFRLTGQEARLFAVLLRRDLVTKELAMMTLYPTNENVEDKIIDVFICKIRKKLKPFGIVVETVWGRGYRLPPQGRREAERIMKEEAA